MTISDFCRGTYKACPKLKSQEKFIDAMSKAAGCQLYVSPTAKKQIFTRPEKFTCNLKNCFREKDTLFTLANFFENNLADDRLEQLAATFGIPEAGDIHKRSLSIALALQFHVIVDTDEIDAEDVLAMEYQRHIAQPEEEPVKRTSATSIYPGDKLYLKSTYRPTYRVKFYETFEHTWEITNNGTQTWLGRKLYLSNHAEIRPRATQHYIEIPVMPPHKSAKIAVSMDARGFDGKHECHWIMVDAQGKDCFPNSGFFEFIIDVEGE